MLRYTTYRDIRKRAMIWGLPLPRFTLFMISIVLAMLSVIFSFGTVTIVLAVIWNALLYMALLRADRMGDILSGLGGGFPGSLSNKEQNISSYVGY